MKFKAEIDIMPHAALLDPQGKAVTGAMGNIGLANISNVRIGKHISLEVDAANEADANAAVETACTKLLANLIVESYSFTIKPM
jgi:phosphoribosylformylglycinamidine synthase